MDELKEKLGHAKYKQIKAAELNMYRQTKYNDV